MKGGSRSYQIRRVLEEGNKIVDRSNRKSRQLNGAPRQKNENGQLSMLERVSLICNNINESPVVVLTVKAFKYYQRACAHRREFRLLAMEVQQPLFL